MSIEPILSIACNSAETIFSGDIILVAEAIPSHSLFSVKNAVEDKVAGADLRHSPVLCAVLVPADLYSVWKVCCGTCEIQKKLVGLVGMGVVCVV